MNKKFGELADTHRHLIKETILWEIERGRALKGPQIGHAERLRTALYHRMRRFMKTYEFLALPVVQVPPFPIEQPYVTEINGVAMETYIDWMRSCYYVSITSCRPLLFLPGSRTTDCRLDCNWSGATAMTLACCNWRTLSSRRPDTGGGARRLCDVSMRLTQRREGAK